MEHLLLWFNGLVEQIKAVTDEEVAADVNWEGLEPVLETDSDPIQLSPDLCRFLSFSNAKARSAEEANRRRHQLMEDEVRATIVSGDLQQIETLANRFEREEEEEQTYLTILLFLLWKAIKEEYPGQDWEQRVMRKGGVLVRPKTPEESGTVVRSIIVVPADTLNRLPGVRA